MKKIILGLGFLTFFSISNLNAYTITYESKNGESIRGICNDGSKFDGLYMTNSGEWVVDGPKGTSYSRGEAEYAILNACGE